MLQIIHWNSGANCDVCEGGTLVELLGPLFTFRNPQDIGQKVIVRVAFKRNKLTDNNLVAVQYHQQENEFASAVSTRCTVSFCVKLSAAGVPPTSRSIRGLGTGQFLASCRAGRVEHRLRRCRQGESPGKFKTCACPRNYQRAYSVLTVRFVCSIETHQMICSVPSKELADGRSFLGIDGLFLLSELFLSSLSVTVLTLGL